MAVIGNAPFQGLVSGGNILDASIEGVDLSTSAIAARLGYTPVDPGNAAFSATLTAKDIQQDNATYIKGKLAAGTATRLFGINASDTLYIGSVDANHTGGTLFVKNGVTQMSLSATSDLTVTGDLINNGGRVSLYRSAGASYIDWASGQNLLFRTETSAGGAGASTLMTILSTGKVGIGTSTPGYLLQVGAVGTGAQSGIYVPGNFNWDGVYVQQATSGGRGAAITLAAHVNATQSTAYKIFADNDSASRALVISYAADTDTYANASYTERVRIDSTGKVGINTTSPVTKLHIEGSTAVGTVGTERILVLGRAISGGVSFQQAASFDLGRHTATDGVYHGFTRLDLSLKDDQSLSDYNTNVQVMTWLNSGKVGINTTSPGVELDVRTRARVGDGTNTLTMGYWDGVSNRIESVNKPLFLTSYSDSIRFGMSGSEVMRIHNNSYVGIGTTSPGSLLDIQNAGTANINVKSTSANGGAGITLDTGATLGYSNQIVFANSGSSKWALGGKDIGSATGDKFSLYNYSAAANFFTIDTAGKVGIGTVSPSYKLSVIGDIYTPNNGTYDDQGLVSRNGAWTHSNGGYTNYGTTYPYRSFNWVANGNLTEYCFNMDIGTDGYSTSTQYWYLNIPTGATTWMTTYHVEVWSAGWNWSQVVGYKRWTVTAVANSWTTTLREDNGGASMSYLSCYATPVGSSSVKFGFAMTGGRGSFYVKVTTVGTAFDAAGGVNSYQTNTNPF
jgi:hypothetical protein